MIFLVHRVVRVSDKDGNMATNLLLCPRCGASLSLLHIGPNRASVAACDHCFVAAPVGPNGALSSVNLALIRKADRRRGPDECISREAISQLPASIAFLT